MKKNGGLGYWLKMSVLIFSKYVHKLCNLDYCFFFYVMSTKNGCWEEKEPSELDDVEKGNYQGNRSHQHTHEIFKVSSEQQRMATSLR